MIVVNLYKNTLKQANTDTNHSFFTNKKKEHVIILDLLL